MTPDWHAPLCDLLGRLAAAHEAWLGACREHGAALRTADTAGAARAQQAQQAAMQRIAELEHERRTLAEAAAATTLRRGDARPPTIDQLAARLTEPEAAALRERAASLRTLIEQVQREQAALKLASRTLAAHMEGLLRQVARRLGEQAAYGPPVRSAAMAGGPAALDVTL